jgi:hypothetical protein
VTELLNGLGKLVRAGALRKLGWQTGLLALFLLLVIIATWIDAWESLRDVSLDIAGLWAPVLVAILYYLAAAIIFPEHPADWPSLDDYFVKRKRAAGAILLANEFVVNYTYLPHIKAAVARDPALLWHWFLPYNVAIKLVFLVFIFARGRLLNVAALAALILIFLLPYWHRVA